MCRHSFKEINDLRVCIRCGLTINKKSGGIMFDRNLPSIGKKGKGNK